MPLPDIPGLRDTVSVQNGLTLGATFGHICDVNGGTAWMNQAASIVFNSDYVADQYILTPEPGVTAGLANVPNDNFLYGISVGNRMGILCAGYYGTNRSFQQKNSWVGAFSTVDSPEANLRLETYNRNTQDGTAINSFSNFRVVIDGFDRDHYLLVPFINAKKIDNTTINNIDYKTFKQSYLSQYPYIVSVTTRCFYKPDFNSTTTFEVPLCYLTYPTFIEYLPSTNFLQVDREMAYNRLYYTGQPTPGYERGHIIFSAPPGTTFFAPTVFTADNIGYHYPQGYGSHYTLTNTVFATSGAWFTATSFNVIEAIMNATGFWWGESQSEVANNAKGAATTAGTIHAPKITGGGATTIDGYQGGDIGLNWNNAGDRPLGGISIVFPENLNPSEKEDKTYEGEDPDPLSESGDPDSPLVLDEASFTGVGCFTTTYLMTEEEIYSLNAKLWTSDQTFLDELLMGLKLWGTDPMESMISLRLYPFNISSYVSNMPNYKIYFGRTDMDVTAAKVNDNATCILKLGSVFMKPVYGDFRDYEPYTQMWLYVPYCGIQKINPAEFMNVMLTINMSVDILTGSCVASIESAPGRPIMYMRGMIGTEIPLTRGGSVDYINSIISATMSTTTAAIAGGLGAEAAAPAGISDASLSQISDKGLEKGAASGIPDMLSDFTKAYFGSSVQIMGAPTPSNSLNMPQAPFIIITTPKEIRPANFNHTYGKPCHTSGHLSSFSGFTKCVNVDTTGIVCTDEERSAIRNLLQSGIYI